jgi:hypothetical protein
MQYAELAILHGVNLLFSKNVKERPCNRKLKNSLKHLQNLIPEFTQELKSKKNMEFRSQFLRRLLTNKNLKKKNYMKEKQLMDNISNAVNKTIDEDFEHGINALRFIADKCVRYNMEETDIKIFVRIFYNLTILLIREKWLI